jgi:hypothetical protein
MSRVVQIIRQKGVKGDPGIGINDALTTKPTEPGVIWFELPGRYLRMTAPWLFNAGAWDDTGAWYDSQEWAD